MTTNEDVRTEEKMRSISVASVRLHPKIVFIFLQNLMKNQCSTWISDIQIGRPCFEHIFYLYWLKASSSVFEKVFLFAEAVFSLLWKTTFKNRSYQTRFLKILIKKRYRDYRWRLWNSFSNTWHVLQGGEFKNKARRGKSEKSVIIQLIISIYHN